MEYVHEVNEEFKENIKQMLMSPDPDTIKLAIEILNHTDLSNKETKDYIMELILTTDCGLGIGFSGAKLSKKDIVFFYEQTEYYMEEEPVKENFHFYSTKIN